jgi:hypothetical protein
MAFLIEGHQYEYQLGLLKKVGKVGWKIEGQHRMEIPIKLLLELSKLSNQTQLCV